MRRKRITFTERDFGDTCSLCKAFVHARDIVRLDSEYCRCPHCGGVYAVAPAPRWSQLGGNESR